MTPQDDGHRFEEALEALYSPLHQARTPEALKQSSLRRTRTVQDMRTYMKRVGCELPARVKIVHVTGTKGKGSTVSMCEAILRERYGQKTGLFTSPHLVDIRERIRIDGQPVSKTVFAEAYWELNRRLVAMQDDDTDLPTFPGYFRMLTLMALYIFTYYEPAVDVILLEVGVGGRYDATNLFDLVDTRQVVCGVTLLDFDHTRVLGTTLEQIAWEKGGIFQVRKGLDLTTRPTDEQQPSFLVDAPIQPSTAKRFFALGTNTPSALSVLRACAAVEGQQTFLHIVHEGQSLPSHVCIGLKGSHQRINAELAASLCDALMNTTASIDLGLAATYRALESVSWPGRCQSLNVKWPSSSATDAIPLHLCVDGAHTSISLEAGVSWFQSQRIADRKTVLVFNCSHERNPVLLLRLLVSVDPPLSTVYFCRADTERPSMVGKSTAHELLQQAGFHITEDERQAQSHPTWQETLADVWKRLEQEQSVRIASTVFAAGTVREAFQSLHERANIVEDNNQRDTIQVFVTGSLYIVGSALDAVGWTEEDAPGTLIRST